MCGRTLSPNKSLNSSTNNLPSREAHVMSKLLRPQFSLSVRLERTPAEGALEDLKVLCTHLLGTVFGEEYSGRVRPFFLNEMDFFIKSFGNV